MDFPIFSHDFPSYKHPFIEIFHYHRLSTGGQLYPQPQATPVASSGIIISIETTMRISIKPFELKPLYIWGYFSISQLVGGFNPSEKY